MENMIIEYGGNSDDIVWRNPQTFFSYGVQLIVNDEMEAVLYKDGRAIALFVPGRYIIDAREFPELNNIINTMTDNRNGFAGEFYFIKKTTAITSKWGTDTKVSLFDPASGVHVEIGASGEFTINVTDSKKLLPKFVNSADSISQNQIIGGDKGYFRGLIMSNVKSMLAQTIKAAGINILEIDEHLVELSEILKLKLNEVLAEFGIAMSEFLVVRVITPTRQEDPLFWKMKEQYSERYLKVKDEQIKNEVAQAEAVRMATEMKAEQQRKVMAAHGDADVMRIMAQAEADRRAIEGTAAVQEPPVSELWDCECGKTGIDGNFCSNCGSKRPQKMVPATWNCSCGKTFIDGNFCSNCGSRKPE